MGLSKNRATSEGEQFAVIVRNKLPEAVTDKKHIVEVVYKLMELLEKTELRRGARKTFVERVRKFLRSEPGKVWCK